MQIDALRQQHPSVWRVTGDPLVPGAANGPLVGCGIAVKDTYAVAGHKVGAGTPAWLEHAQTEHRHADVIQVLLDAGADIIGIAQTVELAYSLSGVNPHYGAPPNPAAPGRVPGGSSSGSASAVASGIADIGLGSDTAGSIRVPASYCGLFGQRVTHSAVSTAGLLPLAPEFDTVGWMTRDAETLDAVAQVLLPEVDAEPPTRLIVAEDLFALADPTIGESLREATNRFLSQAGLPHDRTSVLAENRVEDWASAFTTVQAAQAWENHGAWIENHPGALSVEVGQRFNRGRHVTAAQLEESNVVLNRARAHLGDLLQPGTVLIQPAASTTAPRATLSGGAMDELRAGTLRLTSLASIAGLPVVTIPAGDVGGHPIGLCLVGAPHTDRALSKLSQLSNQTSTASRRI